MSLRFICLTAILVTAVSIAEARIANPYPVAVLRKGDIYLLKSKGDWQKLTETGDVTSLCWLDRETICFSRSIKTGLKNQMGWRGLETISDLFLIKRDGSDLRQFTNDHFASQPSPAPIPGRALFAHIVPFDGMDMEIWETIKPPFSDRTSGIRGSRPDSSPNRRWTTAQLIPEGIGLYRYPTNDAYRKLTGSYHTPRFSPDSEKLTFFATNSNPDSSGIWGHEIPDGDPELILPMSKISDQRRNLLTFGWTADGSGFILVLAHDSGKRDVFFYEIELKSLQQLSDFGDIDQATAWH